MKISGAQLVSVLLSYILLNKLIEVGETMIKTINTINTINTIKTKNMKNPTNGIYDVEGTFPSIHAIPNAGHKFIVSITDDFDEPRYYDEVVALLASASEDDTIIWNINSKGGFVDTLQMLLGWKAMCQAKQIHVLCGDASSCASAFFLSEADEYIVSEGATLFIHEFQVGNRGTNSNVVRRVEHTTKENERFVRETYKWFLDESNGEIDEVLRGVEFYFNADEIRQRLQKREEIKAGQQNLNGALEENTLEDMSDDELQDELDGLADVIKELKKEQAKRKKGHK